ncbi:MAG TPA: undecaprenyldiphospho-muramoylpentapeptide beta-N-acetylglucosaminyltransferase [Candidatus Acidoferrales bacterium]|nr:undecaprenyldiphospho-muramoylpentapeptide beta-N-acetylglucosaminyltransferase [Candidatus Acidoferrales bacterium]
MKVIIAGGGTGGHLFPAVALGEEMIRERPGIDVLFVGTSAGLEAKWLPTSGLRYELFEMHGIRGHNVGERIRSSIEFLAAIWLARVLIRRDRPDLVVSAGGYASAAMGAAAILTGTPLVLMEQNTRPGLSNQLLWRFAKKVCVGFSDSVTYFSSSKAAKVEVTGNPVRFQYRPDRARADGAPLQILVLGGSTGAHRLNIGVVGAFKICGKSVINLHVVHQTGEADEELVRRAYSDMQLSVSVSVVPFIDDIATALHDADLIIARSGAMTVTDITLAARPAVFVPYPFHKDMQQFHNARVIEKRGGAIIVNDDEHLASNLAREITALVSDPARLLEMGERAHLEARPDAARNVAKVCFEVAGAEKPAA